MKTPDTPAAPATSTEPTESYEDYAVPRNEKDLASAFMKVAQSKLSGFTTKYRSDPKADTSKELASGTGPGVEEQARIRRLWATDRG